MVLGPVQVPSASYCRDQDTLLPCPGRDATELPVAHVTGMCRDEGWNGLEIGNTVTKCELIIFFLSPLWSVKVYMVCLFFLVFYTTFFCCLFVWFGFGGQDLTMYLVWPGSCQDLPASASAGS